MLIKMKNEEIEGLVMFLHDLKLRGKHSRMRTRFIKTLQVQLKQTKEEHKEMLLQHSNLDKDGNPLIVEDKNGHHVYDVKDLQAFNKDYNELMTEDFIIEVTEENKEMIESVKNSVCECDKEFSGDEAFLFERYCEIVEGEAE